MAASRSCARSSATTRKRRSESVRFGAKATCSYPTPGEPRMKLFRGGRLLFRTYLVIVGGLVATAAVFDYGFGRLQELRAPPSNGWAEATLALVEARLAAVP